MTKHTPGPWTLKEADTTIPVVGANGRTVATVRYRDNDYADACLIAAAPTLYDALAALCGQYEHDNPREYPIALQVARAALALADGEV